MATQTLTQDANEPARAGRHLPAGALARRGRTLLHQQCWLWGQDIRRPEGNLLLLYGFERLHPPAGCSGSSQYNLTCASGATLSLWGFSFFYGSSDGIFVNRFDFVPRAAEPTKRWRHVDEPNTLPRAPLDAHLPAALRWIAGYERWVLEGFGLSYRRRCLATWPSPALLSEALPNEWDNLANDLDVHLATAVITGSNAKMHALDDQAS